MALTSAAKAMFETTVGAIRERLLTDITHEAEASYRLFLPLHEAGLDEACRVRRARLERWLDEQERASWNSMTPAGPSSGEASPLVSASRNLHPPASVSGSGSANPKRGSAHEFERKRHLENAVRLAGATFLNRIVTLRQMEALGLVKPRVVAGGWQSPAYREFREFGPGGFCDDATGYLVLLSLVFDEVALALPGLFGRIEVSELLPVPPSTASIVVQSLDASALEEIWGDDTLLGWLYQFWNDPDRKQVDEKLDNGGRARPDEIATKTQLFTERYMVDWLLQNSVGSQWLAICDRNDWTPAVFADGTIDRLEERRTEWRAARDRGEVPVDALMPVGPGEERRWKYWVQRSVSLENVAGSPSSIRDVKLLDPMCGSGHFLAVAFDLLAGLYEEEARHRGESWSRREIARQILEGNLHGIDLDSRAIQLASASLMIRAWSYCGHVEEHPLNLVATDQVTFPSPVEGPPLHQLALMVQKAVGIPDSFIMKVLHALRGARSLGSLLKVDSQTEEALGRQEKVLRASKLEPVDGTVVTKRAGRSLVVELLERCSSVPTSPGEMGMGEIPRALSTGVRLLHLLCEAQYHLVVGNAPFLGLGMISTDEGADHGAPWTSPALYIGMHYPHGRADLYAAFIQRSLELALKTGKSALLTMRKWLFLTAFTDLRLAVLARSRVDLLCDLETGAFSEITGQVVSVCMGILERFRGCGPPSLFFKPSAATDCVREAGRTARKEAALLCGTGRFECRTSDFSQVEGSPFIYWWDANLRTRYSTSPRLGEQTEARVGMQTSQDVRFLRRPWEVALRHVFVQLHDYRSQDPNVAIPDSPWVPFIKGAEGKSWMEPLCYVLRWHPRALEVKSLKRNGRQASRPQNEGYYFRRGVAFSGIGDRFLARLHRFVSVFGHMGSSVFPKDPAAVLCMMNSRFAQSILTGLNPGMHFEVGDVVRLPLLAVDSAGLIVDRLDAAFTEHEAAREASLEFRKPGPSAWRYTQDWAQRAVDRSVGDPLPPYEPEFDGEAPYAHVSFAVGVALGRYGGLGQGLLVEAPATSLPDGILYLSSYAPSMDGLSHPAARPIVEAWERHGHEIADADLRTWLRLEFFHGAHRPSYESRPIWLPLSSARRNFVAWVAIHRWHDTTLQTLLADHLCPEFARLDKEIADVQESRTRADAASRARASKRLAFLQPLHEELRVFIDLVALCAEKGAPAADPRDPAREVDARFRMDLDDGVMINSAALWPLLEAQWKDPKKWWREICRAEGKNDFDWSHLAARYFPGRVDAKCRLDESLALAHGCARTHHPKQSEVWELRLREVLGPEFLLEED